MSESEQEILHGFEADAITPAVRRLNLFQNLSVDQSISEAVSPPPERSGPSNTGTSSQPSNQRGVGTQIPWHKQVWSCLSN